MRAAVREATHHASQRSAFGTVLSSAPAMEALLCDLNAESAAAVALSMHAAEVFDECGPPPSSPSAASTSSASATAAAHATSSSAGAADAYRRLVTAVSKFYVCKQAVGVVAECMELLGGNGYTESARWRMVSGVWALTHDRVQQGRMLRDYNPSCMIKAALSSPFC